jgi:hypothetical protein
MPERALQVVHTCNPNTRGTEAGRLRVQGQVRLHCEILSQKTRGDKNRERIEIQQRLPCAEEVKESLENSSDFTITGWLQLHSPTPKPGDVRVVSGRRHVYVRGSGY